MFVTPPIRYAEPLNDAATVPCMNLLSMALFNPKIFTLVADIYFVAGKDFRFDFVVAIENGIIEVSEENLKLDLAWVVIKAIKSQKTFIATSTGLPFANEAFDGSFC
jgi:hypothetical protein